MLGRSRPFIYPLYVPDYRQVEANGWTPSRQLIGRHRVADVVTLRYVTVGMGTKRAVFHRTRTAREGARGEVRHMGGGDMDTVRRPYRPLLDGERALRRTCPCCRDRHAALINWRTDSVQCRVCGWLFEIPFPLSGRRLRCVGARPAPRAVLRHLNHPGFSADRTRDRSAVSLPATPLSCDRAGDRVPDPPSVA